MRDRNDKKRAVSLLDLLLDDAVDPATKEEIRAWFWSDISKEAKDTAMMEQFRHLAPNMAPDESDHRKYAELSARLNLYGAPRMSVRKKRNTSFLRVSVRIAAAVTLLFGLPGLAYLLIDKHETAVEEYQVAEVTESAGSSVRSILLPDGSSVELQPHSELKYDTDFVSGRLVHLDGEALLTVVNSTNEAGEFLPFSVISDDLRVDVYGTVFRVVDPSGNGDGQSIVDLYDGSVSVAAKDTTIMLKQGEEYYYDHATQRSGVAMIAAKEMAGHGFMPLLRFDESTLGNLITSLAANYGVEFVLPEDIDLSKGKFSGDFQTEDLRSTLNILTRSSMKLSFVLMDDKVFVKRK